VGNQTTIPYHNFCAKKHKWVGGGTPMRNYNR